jgi:hypothetical protein
LRPVVHELAHWGLRTLHPPTEAGELRPGWLPAALRTAFPANPTEACVEFRIGDERAAFVGGEVIEGPAVDPDTVVEGDIGGLYHLVVDRDLDAVTIHGRRTPVRELLAALPQVEANVPLTAA